MPKKSKGKLVNNIFLRLEKKPYKSIKIKSKFDSEKSKKFTIIRISCYILLSVLFFVFSFFVIFKKYKKSPKVNEIVKTDNKTELLPFEPNNEEFFNNLLNTMNTEEKYKGAKECYYNDTDSCLYKYFCPKKVVGKNLKYYGILKDGGYVLTDDLSDIKIAYSFGVNDEFSFEMQLADKGIDVYMYDPSVKNLNFTKYNVGQDKNFSNDINYYQKKLHFFSLGVTGSQKHENNMKTLLEMMKDNGHLNEKNMILKMDIESAEWDVLKDLSDEDMKRFKYISFELHLGKKAPKDYYPDVIKKLSKLHQVIFIRFNDWGHIIEFGNNRFCSCIELTYIIKEGNEFERDNSIYPLKDFNYTNGGGHKLDFDINIFKLFYQK